MITHLTLLLGTWPLKLLNIKGTFKSSDVGQVLSTFSLWRIDANSLIIRWIHSSGHSLSIIPALSYSWSLASWKCMIYLMLLPLKLRYIQKECASQRLSLIRVWVWNLCYRFWVYHTIRSIVFIQSLWWFHLVRRYVRCLIEVQIRVDVCWVVSWWDCFLRAR